MVLYILQTPNVICKEVIGLKNKDILVSIGMLGIFVILLFSILYFVFQPVHSNNDGKDVDDIDVAIVKDKEKTEEPVDEDVDLTAKYVSYETYGAPENSGFKSFMDYRTITNTDSKQYKLQQYYAETGEYGIRMVDSRYIVAIGTYFTSDIGQYFDIILENGTVIPCILGDQKADVDTDSDNIITKHNGCMSEFIVDSDALNEDVKFHGDMSYCSKDWDSPIKTIKVYNRNIFEH